MTYVFVNVRFPEEKSRGNGTKSVNNVRELVFSLGNIIHPPQTKQTHKNKKKYTKKQKILIEFCIP